MLYVQCDLKVYQQVSLGNARNDFIRMDYKFIHTYYKWNLNELRVMNKKFICHYQAKMSI